MSKKIVSYRNPKTIKGIIRNLQIFHGRIKEMNSPSSSGGTILMDLGSGKLNDLQIWQKKGYKKVYAIEVDKASISIGMKKYASLKRKFSRKSYKGWNPLPQVIYINADLTRDDMTLKMPELEGTIDHIVCNFAFHYFLKNKKTVDLIIKIINFFLKSRGTFRMTVLNGNLLWKKLLRNPEWKSIEKKGGIEYFKIRRILYSLFYG